MGNVVVLCAHPDDEIIGVGGTIARYSKLGKKVYILIFTYGEMSHLWMREDVTRETREKESREASALVGSTEVVFLGLHEGKLKKELQKQEIKKKILSYLKKWNPERIFMHASDDPHRDHKALSRNVQKMLHEIKYDGEIYTFDIWNPIKFKGENTPQLVVDISKTFPLKVEAMKMFKSQKVSLLPQLPAAYSRALSAGREAGFKSGELFYKIQ